MISIIICTAKLSLISAIEVNISKTIGVEYELIAIDNSNSQYSIFQAYNIGVKRSKFPILCFMHDDIIYHSIDWGCEVIKHFNSQETGMIGIGGTRFLSCIPTIWWAGGHRYFNSKTGIVCHNSIDTNRNNLNETKYNIINPENGNHTKVAILDGLWFCIRKDLFEKIEFDEIKYNGFHFYDLDISMQIKNLNYDIFCLFNIKIEHISSSKTDENWIKNSIIFYSKWQSNLPTSLIKMSFKQFIIVNYNAFKIGYNIYKSNNVRHPFLFLLNKSHFLKLFSYYVKSLKF